MRACFGTTKYCNAFLKGIVCNNTDCLYLHAVGEETSPLQVVSLSAWMDPRMCMPCAQIVPYTGPLTMCSG